MSRLRATALLLLLFVSGFAALLYQVLWLRQLGLLFGNTAYAASITLAVFFLGLAIGSYFWGGRAGRTKNPLRSYAMLELAIAVSAGAHFGLLDSYHLIYAPLFRSFSANPGLAVTVKVLLAATMLLPAAIFMGGTLPMMAQYLIRNRTELGLTGTGLYAIKTYGGAAGAFVAGFYLPPALGFTASYLTAMVLSGVVGIAAFLMSGGPRPATFDRTGANEAERIGEGGMALGGVLGLAALSGFATLCLEVLWTKMFAQVLHNSVYSFSIILVTFLLSLGLGSGLAHLLCRWRTRPLPTLITLLMGSGIAVGLSPYLFHWLTDGMSYVGAGETWNAYVHQLFLHAALIMLPSGVLAGTVFPYLLRLSDLVDRSAGKTVGRLTAINTLGAIAGSLAAGFLLLETLGLWASINAIALLYFAIVLVVQMRSAAPTGWRFAPPLVALLVFATSLDASRLPIVRLAASGDEVLHEYWEGPHGIVAVVQRGKSLRIKVDNYYSLGGTASRKYEQTQADIPLLIHRRPKRVFFLGLGTGITAGAALSHPVSSVTAVELIPEVAEAARRYFGRYTNGMFADERAEVVVEDGRHFLRATDDRYDVVVSDLFIPWRSGAGSLYTLEHFEMVSRRLAPGGLFALWLPLYQLSRDEFMIIARTILEVFPQVGLWRADFFPRRPIVALVARNEMQPLDVDAVVANFKARKKGADTPRRRVMATVALFYVANLSENDDLFAGYPINRDDLPLIEYSSPVTQRERHGSSVSWFTSAGLASWYDELVERAPPASDPYLADLDAQEIGFVEAGHYLFKSKVYADLGNEERARRMAEEFRKRVPAEFHRAFDDVEPADLETGDPGD